MRNKDGCCNFKAWPTRGDIKPTIHFCKGPIAHPWLPKGVHADLGLCLEEAIISCLHQFCQKCKGKLQYRAQKHGETGRLPACKG